MENDRLEWIVVGDKAVVRRKREVSSKEVRRRINELRRKAPTCFVARRERKRDMYGEAVREWALAKLGLMG